MNVFLSVAVFLLGLITVVLTLFSALSTFVLPRAARGQLNRFVFGGLRRVIKYIFYFVKTFEQRDAIMAYYAPIGIMLLVPAWYALTLSGFAAMYWAMGVGDWLKVFQLSGSSLLTLGFATENSFVINAFEFVEAMLGLILVALLVAYLPTMYAAFSRREQAVNMHEVRAGSPPSALEMLLRFNRIHGLENLNNYWRTWEAWFADLEESHTTLPALVFFRSPRAENSWVTAGGAVLDAAALTLSAVDVPFEPSAALCIRSGYLAFRRIATYFDLPNPRNPHYPEVPICVERREFDEVLDQLHEAGVPLKADREQAWIDFAGWRVNYDRSLILLCGLVMAPKAPWSSDRVPDFDLTPMLIFKKSKYQLDKSHH